MKKILILALTLLALAGVGGCAVPGASDAGVDAADAADASVAPVAPLPAAPVLGNYPFAFPVGPAGGAGTGTYPNFGVNVGSGGFITGTLPAGNGGTGNDFFQVSGPAGSVKTYTFPNVSSTVLTTASVITVPQGGTGDTSLTTNGVMIGEGTANVNVTAAGTNGQILTGQTGADPLFETMTGDGTFSSAGVFTDTRINGATVPAAGSLVTGQVLQVSGASSLTYATVPASGLTPGTAGQVMLTNATPAAAWTTVSGDTTISSTGVTTTSSIHGATVPAAGALTTGNVLQVSGVSADTYAPLNLGGGANYVTNIGSLNGATARINNSASPYQALAATPHLYIDVQTGNVGNLSTVVAPPVNPTNGAAFSIKVNLGDSSAASILIEPAVGQPTVEDPSSPGTFRGSSVPFAAIKSGPGGFATWNYDSTLNEWLLRGAI